MYLKKCFLWENEEQEKTKIKKKALGYIFMTFIMIHLSQTDVLEQYIISFLKSTFSINTKNIKKYFHHWQISNTC